jgi:phosphoribosyl-ATP pyrophosphohydrolase
MIIPKVSAARFEPNESGLQQLLARLNHWSLFGSIALTDNDGWDLDKIEFVTRVIGGRVDLEIELNQPTAGDALRLLNAGAESIICQSSESSSLAGVPADRVTRLLSTGDETFKNGDQVEIETPEASRLAHMDQIGVDCLVSAEFLDEHPEVISHFYSAALTSDRPDGLWPTIIIDSLGQALGLAYSNEESLLDAITHRRGTYWSRSRDELWVKGKTSGAEQSLIGIRIDCDSDCLRFQVDQRPPGFCHKNTYACFGKERTIATVIHRLRQRIESSDEKSFTKTLVNDPSMLRTKLLEEAEELSDAQSPDEIAWEAADVLYFSLVKLLGNDVGLDRVFQELARRMNRVVRRKNKLVE